MNKDSMTTLQKGNPRNLSPVHIHLTDSTPLHVFLEKPVRPKPVYPKIASKTKTNLKSISGKNNSNSQNRRIAPGKRKGTPESYDFGKSYAQSSGEEKPDLMEFSQSQKLLKEKEHMLEEYRRRLTESEEENRKLVKNMEEICLELEGGAGAGGRKGTGEELPITDLDLSRLSNSQHFLQGMAIKLDDFGTMLRHLRQERILCISNAELDALLTHKKILERDLVTFDDVCIFLRRKMREMIESKTKMQEMMIERGDVLARLEKLKESHELLKKNLTEAEGRAREAFSELDGLKMEQTQSNTIIETLRMTKAHLQRELLAKEGECNKLCMKVKDLQARLEKERQTHERLDQDRENLKKATRLHKTKAYQKAESLEQLNRDLRSRDSEIKDLTQEVTSLRFQLSQLATEKMAMAAELNETKLKLVPSAKLSKKTKQSSEDEDYESPSGSDDDKVAKKRSNRVTKKEAGIHKTSFLEAESKEAHVQAETIQLKLKVQEFENLLDDYKEQVSLARQEAERYRTQVEQLKRELSRAKSEKDLDAWKSNSDEVLKALNSNTSNNQQQLGNQKLFSDRIEMLDKKIITLEDENRELAVLNGKREEALHQTNLRLEEKMTENLTLQRQLDTLMADYRRMKDSEKDKIAAADRSSQILILELEGQISQLKHDIEKLKREKEEVERRMNQKLYDFQDELKQSHSTNRALQNFIHFLKSSYNATFDQPPLATFSSIPNLSSMGR